MLPAIFIAETSCPILRFRVFPGARHLITSSSVQAFPQRPRACHDSGRAAEFGSRKPHGYLDSQHEQACCRSTGPRSGGGIAVFLGNEEKVFVIYVDQSVGVAIA